MWLATRTRSHTGSDRELNHYPKAGWCGLLPATRFIQAMSIGTPLDVTAQNLRIEHFFPMDESSKAYWQG
ncbi:MAG: hypothetical protein ACPHQ9_02995 [Marinobacter sp.]|uniref:hypothetical protein n=1 Tax=Marinobacter sp. TaxID=50741 RepID=UPI003C5A8D73